MSIVDVCVKREQRDDASKEDEPVASMKSGEAPAAGGGGSVVESMSAAGSAANRMMSMAAGAAAVSGDASAAGSAAVSGDAGVVSDTSAAGASGEGGTAGGAGSAGAMAGGPCGGKTCNSKADCVVDAAGARVCKCLNNVPGDGVTPGSCGEECATPGSCGACATGNGGCSVSPKAMCSITAIGELVTCTCPSGIVGSGLGRRGCVFTVTSLTALDSTTRLTWQRALMRERLDWKGAVDYCSRLPLEGTGWRLPTSTELTLLGEPAFAPSLDPLVFTSSPAGGYWTSTEDGIDNALIVPFDRTVVQPMSVAKSTEQFVRCVR